MVLKFELLCIDQDNKVKFKKFDNFIKALSIIESLWMSDLLEDPLEIGNQIQVIKIIEDKTQGIKVSIQAFDTSKMVTGERYSSAYYLTVEGEFDRIEPFRVKIIDQLKDLGFNHVRILSDEASYHIAIQIYPLLNKIENLLRRYIAKFFITKIGTDWWSIAISKENRDKAKGMRNNELIFAKSQRVITDVTLLNFDQLGKIIYSQSSVFTKTEDIFEKIKNANDLEILKQELLEGNYVKYFKDSFEQKDFQSKWEQLNSIRNKVAHNNYFIKEDLELARKLSQELTLIINDADSKIDDLTLSIADKEAVRKAIDDLVETEKEEPQREKQEEKNEEKLCDNSLETNITQIQEQSYLSIIGEEDLISKLEECSKTREFVGLKYFVRDYLGSQGYSFHSSYALINLLADKGKIKIYEVPNPYGEYNTTAIKLLN